MVIMARIASARRMWRPSRRPAISGRRLESKAHAVTDWFWVAAKELNLNDRILVSAKAWILNYGNLTAAGCLACACCESQDFAALCDALGIVGHHALMPEKEVESPTEEPWLPLIRAFGSEWAGCRFLEGVA